MNSELVSICIPTFNSECFLEDTLRSIINQTYNNFEIIIGDNASTDQTNKIIKKFALNDNRISYYFNEENIGYSANCNKLISKANGNFISIYHSDDIYEKSIIENQVNILVKNPNILGVFTSYNLINSNGDYLKNIKYPIDIKNDLAIVQLETFIKIILNKSTSCFCCPTSMIRKSVYVELTGYDENIKFIEDQDMWARILLKGPLAILNEKLINYRIHEKQGSSIYFKRIINKYSIPLQHILTFIDNNSLGHVFENEIFKAESKELLFFARKAAEINNYTLFRENLKKSKIKHTFKWYSKLGIIQYFPLPKILFLLVRTINNNPNERFEQ